MHMASNFLTVTKICIEPNVTSKMVAYRFIDHPAIPVPEVNSGKKTAFV